MKLEKGMDYWYISFSNYGGEIKAETVTYIRDNMPTWNVFGSRKEAERALAKIILLLTEEEIIEPKEGE